MSTQLESKHTPGPWKQHAPRVDGIVDESYRSIVGGKGNFLDGNGFDITGFMTEADARLIAAAPELLEACLSALARFEVEQSFGPHRQQLYAAIFSATGVPVDNQSDDMGQNTSSCE